MTVTAKASALSLPRADGDQTWSWSAKQVHFVGIGGCGMSGLARLVKQAGARCSGSDMQHSETIDALRAEGFEILMDQSAAGVPAGCQLMVTSAAIGPDHPERLEAARRGVDVLKYAQVLGRLMVGKTGVAVAGTHGKSTTTSMLCHALIHCQLDPSFIVGAHCRQIGGGWRCGQSDTLVAEACEFDRSFHHLHPTHGVILNVEEDHMDIYGSIDAIIEAFAKFAHLLPTHGSLLIQHEMAHRLRITAGLRCRTQTIGFAPQADWCIRICDEPDAQAPLAGSTADARERRRGDWIQVWHRGQPVAQWPAAVPGEHMAYNAAAAAVTAHQLGAPWEGVSQAMAGFQGLDRRMQFLGTRRIPVIGVLPEHGVRPPGEVAVVDDYGHHPTEIDTTLRALRRHHQPKRLICVFQPHQHSRTRFLMHQFAASFAQADIVIVPHIYFVRDSEQERHTVSAADLVDRLRQREKQAMHLYPFDAIVEQLDAMVQPGDLLVTMGAGDVWKVAAGFLNSA